jgi:hypothetical protein
MESGPDYHNYVTTMSGCVMIRGRIERLSSNVSRLNRLVEEIDL